MFRDWFNLQKQNLLFFFSIAFAFGAGVYFTMNTEPNIILLVIIFVLSFLGLFLQKRILFPLLALFLGFGYSGLYTHIKNTSPISHDKHNVEISGTISNIDYTTDKTRLYIKTKDYGLVRVSTNSPTYEIKLGDTITGTGGLFKPEPAPMPETFDMARWSFFNGISASGYISNPEIITHAKSGILDNIRQTIHNKTKSFLTDGLILGYKNTLSAQDRQVWATNGVAHLWSISGYHLALFSGWLFAIFYIVFKLCFSVTKRIPARIPALAFAWVGLLGYLVLSGASVATQRAFIMTSFIITAFIIGRDAFSLRTACLAFLILILANPFYVMTAGFQLSFAAIFGIIWLWSVAKPQIPENKLLKYLYTAVLTAFIALVFTTPFVIAHFNSLPIYSLISNIIMVPIFSFILMPLVVIGTIFALLGVHSFLDFAHKIYDYIFQIANWIYNLPYADVCPPNISNIALAFIIVGLASMIFIRNDDKFKTVIMRHLNFVFAFVFITLGLVVWSFTPKPIFYISPDHNLIATVQTDGLHFNKIKDSGNYFAFDTWKKSNGEQPNTPNKRFKAEKGVHTIKTDKWELVYIQRFVPLSQNLVELCKSDKVSFIASFYDIKSKYCDSKIIRGGAVIYKSGHIKKTLSNRWWHNRHE